MANFFSLVEQLENSLESLNKLLVGGNDETVIIDGKNRSSIAKSIKDSFSSLQSQVQGRLSYKTKAEMQSAGMPAEGKLLAEVWNDTDLESNGLYGWSEEAWIKSPLDTVTTFNQKLAAAEEEFENKILLSSASLKSNFLDVLMSDTKRRVPLSENEEENNIVYAVVSNGKILGYYDTNGKFHSDHDHEEITDLYEKVDQIKGLAPMGEQDIVHAIVSDGKILGYYDTNGKFHSDHDHEEIESLSKDLYDLNATVSGISSNVSGNNTGYIAHEKEVDGESQIYVHNTQEYSQATLPGSNWFAPLIHSNNVLRCLSDFTTGDIQPHTILPSGKVIAEDSVIYQQLVTGQSLSLGSRGYILNPNGEYTFSAPNGIGDLFTNSCPEELKDHCLMLNNGNRHSGTYFVPTKEQASGVLGETICSSYMISLAYALRAESNGMLPRLVCSISGVGGVPYASLKKGTSTYSAALNRTTEIASAAQNKGWKHVVNQVRIIHGESQGETTEAEYAGFIREWISDYQSDLMAITAQKHKPVGVLCQMNTQGRANKEVPLAQLKASLEYEDIILLAPKYQYGYWDSAHMLAEGYIKTGEIEAKAMSFWFAGEKWTPLLPQSCTLDDRIVRLEFNNVISDGADKVSGPIGNLSIDTTEVRKAENYGFECTDNMVSITDVRIGIDGKSIEITLDASPSVGSYITYALQDGFAQTSNGPRGNIRDNDTRTVSRIDNKPVYNWCVAFKKEII